METWRKGYGLFLKIVAWLSNFPPKTSIHKMFSGKKGISSQQHQPQKDICFNHTRLKNHMASMRAITRKYDLIGCERGLLFLARSSFCLEYLPGSWKRGCVIFWYYYNLHITHEFFLPYLYNKPQNKRHITFDKS